jgi:hypothetical protein
MGDFLADLKHEYRRHKALADRAMAQLDETDFFRRPGEHVNPVALIIKHLGLNLASRWTDFLTTDGEKPSRDRDGEFLLEGADTRERLMANWEHGWNVLLCTLAGLTEADLSATVAIRGEAHSVSQALLRGMTHVAYHTGQILYIVRLLRPESAWLTVPPGRSREIRGGYRRLDEPAAEPSA